MERTLHGGRIGAPRTAARASAPVRPSAPPAPRLSLARAAGNQRMVQARLAIGAVHDPLERAADRAADAVLRAPASAASSPSPVPLARGAAPAVRRCAECGASGVHCPRCTAEERKKERDGVPPVTVRRAPADGGGAAPAPAGFEGRLAGLRGGGEPLPGSVRGFFEPRFGADFSGVRVHTGAEAGEAARSIGARAFTAASDVVFAPGQFAPETAEGSRLLAHELAHVVQQSADGGEAVRRAPDVQRQPAPDPRGEGLPPYVPHPWGFSGIELFYMVDRLPRARYTHMDYEVRRGEYRIVAQLHDPDDDPPEVMYWVAYRRTRKRNEWVIGADDLNEFLANFDHYLAVANQAYAWVPHGAQVPRYQAESARFVRLGVSGDVGGAVRQLGRAWAAAAQDPGWWAQAVTATAGAVAGPRPVPAATVPAAGPPALRVIAGGGGGASAVPATAARVAAPVVSAEASAAPVLATRGSLALAPSRVAVPAPAATPAPAAAAAPRLSLVPPAAPAPTPPVPVSPVVTAAVQAAVSMAGAGTRRAPATAATPQSARRPSPEAEEEDRRGCRVRQVAMKFGRFPCHADFSFALSGVRREFEVTTPEGLTADVDAIDAGGSLYEVKTGYRWVPFTQNEPGTRRLIGHFQDQAFRQLAIAQRCGRRLVWYFNERMVAEFFDGLLPVTVVWRPFPCTQDSDPLTW